MLLQCCHITRARDKKIQTVHQLRWCATPEVPPYGRARDTKIQTLLCRRRRITLNGARFNLMKRITRKDATSHAHPSQVVLAEKSFRNMPNSKLFVNKSTLQKIPRVNNSFVRQNVLLSAHANRGDFYFLFIHPSGLRVL